MKIKYLFSQPSPLRSAQFAKPAAMISTLLSLALLALAGCKSSASHTAVSLPRAIKTLLSETSYAQLQPGIFMMGSPEDEVYKALRKRGGVVDDITARERPPHQVQLTRPLQMGKHEVTQEEWEAVMQVNPSAFKGPGLPVTNVSWYDVQEFIKRLQSLDTEHTYRLPTEAEWEYACRAGSTGDFTGQDYQPAPARAQRARAGNGGNNLLAQAEREETFAAYLQPRAWFAANSLERPHPVGQQQPNAWGLYDMHGNVAEWCQDWFDPQYYRNSPPADPPGPPSGTMKINRGGSWHAPAALCRAATRGYDAPTERNQLLGFRLARVKRESE